MDGQSHRYNRSEIVSTVGWSVKNQWQQATCPWWESGPNRLSWGKKPRKKNTKLSDALALKGFLFLGNDALKCTTITKNWGPFGSRTIAWENTAFPSIAFSYDMPFTCAAFSVKALLLLLLLLLYMQLMWVIMTCTCAIQEREWNKQ